MPKEYFEILAPLRRGADVDALARAGAGEFYCGFADRQFATRWPLAFGILNRRGEGASFENDREFGEAVGHAERRGKPVYVTLNGLYTPEQYPWLRRLVRKIGRFPGVSGLIVADMGFLLFLRSIGFRKPIHIGTGGSCFNSRTARFYADLGVERVILGRHLGADEIRSIVSGAGARVDFEIFALCEACKGFSDDLCTFFHCYEDPPAADEMEIAKGFFLQRSYNTEQQARGCDFFIDEVLAGKDVETLGAASGRRVRRPRFVRRKHLSFGCRLCDLFELQDLPIRSLKIVGRGAGADETLKHVRALAKAVALLSRNGAARGAYRSQCRRIFARMISRDGRACGKYDCYFPRIEAP